MKKDLRLTYEDRLNNRPRAVLGFRTPLEVLDDPYAAPGVVALAS